MVAIIRLIKDGKTVLEKEDLHHMHEELVIRDKDVKMIVVTVAKHR